jgi:hypothetical protein
MSLTTAEATWIGIVLASGFSFGSARIMLAATRNSDHRQRIWDKATELYEQLLLTARAWSTLRENAMRTLFSGSDRESFALDDADYQLLLIRLEMFDPSAGPGSLRAVRRRALAVARLRACTPGCVRAEQGGPRAVNPSG